MSMFLHDKEKESLAQIKVRGTTFYTRPVDCECSNVMIDLKYLKKDVTCSKCGRVAKYEEKK